MLMCHSFIQRTYNMEHFYMYLKHTDSKHLYPSNRPESFTIQLPQPLDLQGDWNVGLWGLAVKAKGSSKQDLLICCDAVVASYVHGQPLRVLKRITLPPKNIEKQFNPIQYFKYDNTVKRDTLQFSISPPTQRVNISLDLQQARYTLHFKRSVPA